jgi:hypothetical protein
MPWRRHLPARDVLRLLLLVAVFVVLTASVVTLNRIQPDVIRNRDVSHQIQQQLDSFCRAQRAMQEQIAAVSGKPPADRCLLSEEVGR